MAKEQVAFELENPNGFVTQARQIGYKGGHIEQALDALNGTLNGSEPSYQTEEVSGFTTGKYYNTNTSVGGAVGSTYANADSPRGLEGCNCIKLLVHAGEIYDIYGKYGGAEPTALLLWTDLNYVVKERVLGTYRDAPYTVNVDEDGYLFICLHSYDASTDKVIKKTLVGMTGGGLIEEVTNAKNDITQLKSKAAEISGIKTRLNTVEAWIDEQDNPESGGATVVEGGVTIVNNLVDGGANKALSAEQGKILKREITGEVTYNYDSITPYPNTFYNTRPVFRDGAQTYSRARGEENSYGTYSVKTNVFAGDTIRIKGKGVSDALGLYVLTDMETNVVSSSMSTSRTEIVLNIESDGILFVNLTGYNSETDEVSFVTEIHTGGLRGYIDEELAKLRINTRHLIGKTIVCFGDSITQFAGDDGKTYCTHLAEMSGATVINVGIGGTMLRKRDTSDAYKDLDVCELVRAVVENDFTAQYAAADAVPSYTTTYRAIIDRLRNIDWASVDAIIVFAGTNGWRNIHANLGTLESEGVGTTMGAVKYIINTLCSNFPAAKLYFLTPIPRWIVTKSSGGDENLYGDDTASSGVTYSYDDASYSDNLVNNEGKHLYDYADAIIAMAQKYSIPVCDMYRTIGFNQANFWHYFWNVNNGDSTTDGTHPRKGFKAIARRVLSFLEAERLF